jgi:hypothetical protein
MACDSHALDQVFEEAQLRGGANIAVHSELAVLIEALRLTRILGEGHEVRIVDP